MLLSWLLSSALLLAWCLVAPTAAQAPDTSDAPASDAEDTDHFIYAHGILMSLGWIALLPLGALIAQNRWLQRMKANVAGKEVWFWIHVAIQAIGAALIIAAFGIAYSPTAQMVPDRTETVAYTHMVIGTIAFSFLLLQILGGLIRPNPGARGRTIWNYFHHNTGRLAVLLAWVNVYLGVAIWYDNGDGTIWNGRAAWVAPLAVAQGLLLIAYIVGAIRKPKSAYSSQSTSKNVLTDTEIATAPPADPLQSDRV